MPRFAANLSLLWPDLSPYARFQAAADAGFMAGEYLFPHELDQDQLVDAIKRSGLELVLFDPRPGDSEHGERGLLCVPGREDALDANLEEGLVFAARSGARRLNVLAGKQPADLSQEAAIAKAAESLRRLAPRAEAAGVLLLIEALNPHDNPGYLASTVPIAADIVRQADHPSVRLQFDQYHVGMVDGDAVALLREYHALVEHVQIADIPGRNQPGTGGQPIMAFLEELDRLGYRGHVGLEYRPLGDMDQALAWLPRERRGTVAASA